MLRYALRRALWAIPTLFGISLVVFLLTTFLPMPGGLSPLEQEEVFRHRFFDLPRFFNASPVDLRGRVTAAVAAFERNESSRGQSELVRLGGAALPVLLPSLEGLSPALRGKVALALMPIAQRMQLDGVSRVQTPDQAVLFWSRFWDDHAIDFTRPAARRDVARLMQRATELRESDLYVTDTFGIGEMIQSLRRARTGESVSRLSGVLSHVTGRDVVLAHADDAKERERVVADWIGWWFVYKNDYQALEGIERLSATITETRYAKWVLGAVTGELGLSTGDGKPVFSKLLARAPLTLGMTLSALLLAVALAVPMGIVSAVFRGKAVDTLLAMTLFLGYSLPTFVLTMLTVSLFSRVPNAEAKMAHLVGSGDPNAGRILAGILILALGSLATLSRYQRFSILEVLRQDYVRTAWAKGLPAWRVHLFHALRNGLLPTVTLVGLQFPVLLGGALVVEEVLSLPGLGFETLRAVELRDAAWLITVTLFSALVTTAIFIATDIASSWLDPRVREGLRPEGRVP